MKWHALFTAAGAIALAGCSKPPTIACPDDLRVLRSPADTTIRVGQQFTPFFRFLGCGGTVSLDDVLTFTSSNTAVIAVDATTGRTTGVSSGAASIQVTGAKYGGSTPITVTVIP